MKQKSPLLFVVILWLATALSSHAAGLSFGAWKWSMQFGAKTATIKLDSITNSRSSGYTGTLRVELWVTNSPVPDGQFTGWKVAEFKTKPLNAGMKRSGFDMTVPLLKQPPKGAKYVTLLITEYQNGKFVTQVKSRSLPHTFK